MTGDKAVISYVEDLFRYLKTYETNYAEFETEAFLQTYQGIGAVFQALRQQRDKAIELDRFFLEKLKQHPLTSSDLRQLTLQILITFFESEADIDGQSNQAYSYCRGVRAIKQDVPFFENHLTPLLFQEGSLNNNFRLHSFLLDEIARYLNTFGKSVKVDLTPEQFQAMSEPMKFLELARRRLQLGGDVLTERSSLEFHLMRIDAFNKLRHKSRLYEHLLKEWRYLVETSFWSKVKNLGSVLLGKLKGAFSSWRYFRLIMTQRNPAFVFYGVIILLFLLVAWYVPRKWQDYSHRQFEIFQQRSQTMQKSMGK